MPDNSVYLNKATTSAQLASQGGKLTPVQADQFINQIFDATTLIRLVRRKRMNAPREEINKIFVGSRIMRRMGISGSENEDMAPYAQNPTFSTLTLDTKKYALPYEISEDALEDNIARQGLAKTLADHFSEQAGLDLEDLALNGRTVSPIPSTTLTAGISAVDVTIPVVSTAGFPTDSDAGFLLIDTELIGYTGITLTTFTGAIRGDGPYGFATTAAAHLIAATVTWSPHPLIGQDDGWIRLAELGGNIVDGSVINSGNLHKTHFFEALRSLPTQYQRGAAKGQLRWTMAYDQWINWQEYLGNQNANRGYDVLAGSEFNPLGIPVVAPNQMRDKKILLTWPMNLIFGIQRDIRIREASTDKAAIMTDMRFYNMTTRVDMLIERVDATVLVTGLTGNV